MHKETENLFNQYTMHKFEIKSYLFSQGKQTPTSKTKLFQKTRHMPAALKSGLVTITSFVIMQHIAWRTSKICINLLYG